MGFITRKIIRWKLPEIWKELTGKEMPVDPDEYDRMLDAIPAAIEKEVGLYIKKHWWDRFIDGISRLPRPLFSFGLFILFFIGAVAPDVFNNIMISYSAAPSMFWVIAITIITSWFGGRIVQEFGGFKKLLGSVSPKTVIESILESRKQRWRLESEKDFKRRIKDESNSLTEDDIQRWNTIYKREN